MAKKQNYVKQELVNLLQSLQAVENLKGVKLAIAIQRNYKIIGNALQDIEEKAIPSEDFMKLADHMRTFDMEKDIDMLKNKVERLEKAFDGLDKVEAI